MDNNNKQSIINESKDNKRKNGFSTASFVLAVAPIAILLIVLGAYRIIDKIGLDDPKLTVAGWLIFLLVWTLPVAAIISGILSVIFGVVGLKKKKTVFAWAGIIIVSLEALYVLWIGILQVLNI